MPEYDTKTRGKIKIPATKKERVQSWREKKKKEGGKSLNVWLDVKAVEQLDALLDRYPRENKSSMMAFAIKTLFEQETTA